MDIVDERLILTPTELSLISDCSLHHHFWSQEAEAAPEEILETVVLETIFHLHASGGPNRVNLPGILRYMESLFSEEEATNTDLTMPARQMIAAYHRRLRDEWGQIIASNEALSLDIRLSRGAIRCEAVIDRLDRSADGGITIVQFITRDEPYLFERSNIKTTLLHALTAAAYPGKRPVRLTIRHLGTGHDHSLQLDEQEFRRNLNRLKERVQAWLEGEVLARPGLHCDFCPYKRRGCPIYGSALAEDSETDLPQPDPSATLSDRNWKFIKGDNLEQTKTDS